MVESSIEKILNKLQYIVLILLKQEQNEEVKKSLNLINEIKESLIKIENK